MPPRTIDNLTFRQGLRADRSVRDEIREERLRGTPDRPTMTAWRGKSARRYVCQVVDLEAVPGTLTEAVLIAVARDAAGVPDRRRVTADVDPADVPAWIASVGRDAATEIHVHRLADTASARAAIVVDLTDAMPADAALITAAHARGAALAAL